MAKKVGDLSKGASPDASTSGKLTKEQRKAARKFDIKAYGKEAEGNVNADGEILIVPGSFNHRKNNPLKKADFASEAIFVKYQGLISQQKSDFYAERATELVAKAERLEKFGSDDARKQAGKLQRAVDQIAVIRQQLIDGGMDEAEVDGLIKDM